MAKKASGLALCCLLAIPAWYLGKRVALVGGPVIGILVGMLLAGVKRPRFLEEGIRLSGKKVLQYSIIALGFNMNLHHILAVGSQSLAVMFFTVTVTLALAWIGGRLLKTESNTTTLIGVGTCICGGSAIAATAPVIDADDREVAYAVSTIFLFNIIAAFVFPPLGRVMGMSDFAFGTWAGTAINDTSSVVAAAYSFSDAAGGIATIIKLTRTLLIIPITLALAFYISSVKRKSGGGKVKIAKVFPWFVLGFVVAAILGTTGVVPAEACVALNVAAKFLIVWAMVGIGLNTNIRSLVKNGFRPIFLGFICWVGISLASLAVQYATDAL